MQTLKLKKKYETYPEYKDSGVEWLGQIPKEWNSRKIISVFDFSNEKVTEATHQPLSVTYEGIKKQIDNAAKVAEGSLRKLVKIGDIAINGRSDRKGAVGISEYEGGVSLVYNVLRKRDKTIDSKYFHYLFRSKLFAEEFYRWGRGIVDDLWTTRESEMKKIYVSLPSSQEQTRIVKFLDKKTSYIDQIIEKKQKLIELLSEKRTEAISQAVTKGIDPKVEFVESGVDWIGKTPKGWEIRKIKYVTRFAYGESLADELRKDGDIMVFGSNGKVGSHKVPNTLSPVIIIGRKGSYGALNYSKDPVFAIDTTYYIDKCHTNENIRWLYYALTCAGLNTLSQDIGVPGLSRAVAYEKLIPVPNFNEQLSIVNYLDKKVYEYDVLINKGRKSIELLQEFKSSLISNAVTGKIKV